MKIITLKYIRQLASHDREGVDIEFKETTGQLNRGMETLCGMMNGNGGIVVFGVRNNGKIVGQAVSELLPTLYILPGTLRIGDAVCQ